ncbi:MAG: hypothetical protein IT383_04565 [Deltaproteobacteria bacterium]|nr:hypothetical protein [Deltaproteobacteria bacterium]
MHRASLLLWLCAGAVALPAQAAEPAGAPAEPIDVEALLRDTFAGTWLDPQEPEWAPRRGERWEASVLIGGEGAFEALQSDALPTIGGVVVNLLGRYYPVDRLAVVFGVRGYGGLDGAPASGTTASTVLSAVTGVRYDLVREGRFSLLWDLYSGPSLYGFADLAALTDVTALAIGGEMGTALAFRYSIGPFTGEARGLVGGRAGATANPFQRAYDAGPFSAVYAGVDVGGTWSFP